MTPFKIETAKIAVIGLGYVGMPLALALAKHFTVTGFDVNARRIVDLKDGYDSNREVGKEELTGTRCQFTAEEADLDGHDLFIVTVPTPIDDDNNPDLFLVRKASETVAAHIRPGGVVVYESTVYPGVTEDICGPILEAGSGLTLGQDFWLGYSPERINPGDTEHTVSRITKVVAGQTPAVTDFLADVYGKTNGGNIFKARDIKTAEASKVIENAQRDINIAFINEVTQVMNHLGLSVYDVLEAARTKWNFLPFRPGLVGGHCIGVDPYYLSHCAQALGHDPQVILAGRRTNDTMGAYFARRLMERLPDGPRRVLLMGFTFKENINDIRNSKVLDVFNTLRAAGHAVDIHDPHAHAQDVKDHYRLDLIPDMEANGPYDAAILCVAHDTYKAMDPQSLKKIVKEGGLIYDLQGIWRDRAFSDTIFYLTV